MTAVRRGPRGNEAMAQTNRRRQQTALIMTTSHDEENTMASDPTVVITPAHRHTPEQERRIREAALDDTIEASFPASDPPSTNPNPDDDAPATK
jgi:hypothetical protein